ncbi:hypothetical protein BJ170DRAFT_681734 [Xylariales sp. AK1849]|nr:hypothetical protein BJ170DRAFT_681734 [Xylariales sp. AK1849]
MAPQPATSGTRFPESLPPRPEPSWGERSCPGARFCWPFDWAAWSLNTCSDKAALLRRVCMWTTLVVRTMTSIMGLVFRLYGGDIGSFNRWHFDVFLLGSAAIHVALVFIVFIVFILKSNAGFFITWYGMWILIFVVYWITTWTPEQQSYV